MSGENKNPEQERGITLCLCTTVFYNQRPHRSSDLLRMIVKEMDGLQAADRITWTSLRHHLATMAQVFALNEGEVELAAQFMGHDIRIHRKYYRLPLNVLQRGWMCQYLYQNVGK